MPYFAVKNIFLIWKCSCLWIKNNKMQENLGILNYFRLVILENKFSSDIKELKYLLMS